MQKTGAFQGQSSKNQEREKGQTGQERQLKKTRKKILGEKKTIKQYS